MTIIYPNPTTDRLYINASEVYKNAKVRVLNALGSIVKSDTSLSLYNGVMNLSDLSSGIYFVVIENDEIIETIKISLQK